MGKILKDETAARLMRFLNGPGDQEIPQRRGGTTSRTPVLVRCTSATAAGGTGVAAQCFPAVVLNINSLVATQEETAAVWLTLLNGSGTTTPIEGEPYYGLYAGTFDPDPGGAGTDSRLRVFATASGGGGGAGSGQCSLASLREIDCIKLNDGEDDVWLEFATSTWTGTNDRGDWVFGWDAAVGIAYLTLDGTRLMNCGNGCFTGGALTGHIAQTPNGTEVECTGESFTVCLSCACCPFEGYDGPGWYCLEVDAVCTPVEILGDGDECEDWVWCSGPYATEAEAIAVCGAVAGVHNSSCNATADNTLGVTYYHEHETNGVVGSDPLVTRYFTFPCSPSTEYRVNATAWTDSFVSGGAPETGRVNMGGVAPATAGDNGGGFVDEPGVANTVEAHCFSVHTAVGQTVLCIYVTHAHNCNAPGDCSIKTRATLNVVAGSC